MKCMSCEGVREGLKTSAEKFYLGDSIVTTCQNLEVSGQKRTQVKVKKKKKKEARVFFFLFFLKFFKMFTDVN